VRSATSFNTHTPFLLIFSVSFFFSQFSLSLTHLCLCVCGYANKVPKTKAVIYTPISPTHLSPWHFLNNMSLSLFKETIVQFQFISQFDKFKLNKGKGFFFRVCQWPTLFDHIRLCKKYYLFFRIIHTQIRIFHSMYGSKPRSNICNPKN